MTLLDETLLKIQPADAAAAAASRDHWDAIAKPLHGLGRFEDAVAAIAGMQRTPRVDISRKALCVFCADNGVVEEGVTQTGPEVTAQVAENMPIKKATAAIFCDEVGADIFPVDIGMMKPTGLRDMRIAAGTCNMAKGPAMTREQAVHAVEAGITLANECAQKGYQLLAAGEMGIGNTTTSSALASVLLDRPVEEMTGRGAGLDSRRLNNKIEVIRRAIERNAPDPEDPLDVLAKVGGFDIAGMTGLFLGGAAAGLPVVIDGFISGVAALLAVRLCPACGDYMLASHASHEPGAAAVMRALGKTAVICGEMNLGEGSGAVMLFPLLDLALAIYRRMPTFRDTDIDAYVPLS